MRHWLVALLIFLSALLARPVETRAEEVDLALVLAVDASGSVNQQRFEMQKRGYVEAFRNPRVWRAIQSGMRGTIAVQMFQWTGPFLQRQSVGWMIVRDQASAEAFALAIEQGERQLFGGGTSISGAIDHGVRVLEEMPHKAARKVIDVSGDGENSSGRPARVARDAAVAQGIVINGLPILAFEPFLDQHYEREVIGGEGSFMIVAKNFETFGDAVLRKLIAEIADLR